MVATAMRDLNPHSTSQTHALAILASLNITSIADNRFWLTAWDGRQ